jgi:hypothetical protein
MFEKTSRFAEKLATGASRRGFLGSVGRWAGATALGLAGVLTTVGTARAADNKTCCTYGHFGGLPDGTRVFFTCAVICVPAGSGCPTTPPNGCSSTDNLFYSASVQSCAHCNKV